MTEAEASRQQLLTELAHWREAVVALRDLDSVASPGAWSGVEQYLRVQVRERLLGLVGALALEVAQLQQALAAGIATADGRARLLRLRARYLQVETVVDFFGDAVNTRTNPRLAGLLAGFDVVAGDSLELLLHPLGLDAPPVLVYLDKGLGASILRAGVRLWDRSNPSPAAAIKLTRHNLSHPTALFHETGHQFAHLSGWTTELADSFTAVLTPRSRELAGLWRSWASEVAADVHAFALCGFAPVPALANAVDGPSAAVYRIIPGDPHPPALIRVLFNAALCRSWYGPGPWDDLARVWLTRHSPAAAGPDARALTTLSQAAFPVLVDACTRQRMAAFRGRALHELADPARAAPGRLAAMARQAGPSLLTSGYLARREPVRILSWLCLRMVDDPSRAQEHHQSLHRWVSRLGAALPEGIAAA